MHVYDQKFFDYIESGSLSSAEVVAPLILEKLNSKSVLDVGCGRGAWCSKWIEFGVKELRGVDGDYVDESNLLFPVERFTKQDLSMPFLLDQQFDLVVSLEVAEHLPEEKADIFVDNLVNHGNVVLFSAATPGQGGEFHVNEQPLEYWREKFQERGYLPFDFLRADILHNEKVMPWYKYNSHLYVHESVESMIADLCNCLSIKPNVAIPDYSPFTWRLRCMLLRNLPTFVVNRLAGIHHKLQLMLNSK